MKHSTVRRLRSSSRLTTLTLGLLSLFTVFGCNLARETSRPGPIDTQRTLLPNGWTISPVGEYLPLGELPLGMSFSTDGQFLAVTNNGTASQELTVINTADWRVAQRVPLHRSWLGVRFLPDGVGLVASGGNDNDVLRFTLKDGRLERRDSIGVGSPWPQRRIWMAGIDVAPDGATAYGVARESKTLYVFDLARGGLRDSLALPEIPYTCLLINSGKSLAISLWGGGAVLVIDPASLRIRKRILVGDHPCDMVEDPKSARLFVACANTNGVDVVDLKTDDVVERLTASLRPDLPPGSTPNSVALSADGSRLLIANADNNCLAVFDVSRPGRSVSLGFIPTAWYPTCVRFHPKSGEIYIACAKGMQSFPNPNGPRPDGQRRNEQYIGSMLKGVLTRLPMPSEKELQDYTTMVYANTPAALRDSMGARPFPLRSTSAAPSPIRHLFYVIKENRTYDQVLGDIPEGNGDPTLCLFPDSVTPNHHALVRQFVLLDNLYCDAEVSADGHNWSMGAYATDYTEKSWPTSYGGRGGEYEFEGGYPIVYPARGYLWDNCMRNGVSYRTYGEFVRNAEGPSDSATGLLPSLVGHTAPFYKGWDLEYSDVDRVREWEKEFSRYERDGDLPAFQTIKLPNDHTSGTASGALSPRAYVAENDLALGLLVERISHSRYWKESAIFVIEDDAQNGPDHVDAHRTVALVISPHVKHRAVDSHLYTTSSMVMTMELLLGLPPLSQFDAGANPMTGSFSTVADMATYQHIPARIDIMERNPIGAKGQSESDLFDFSREDAVPDEALTSVLWQALKGGHPPPPVRSGFVRTLGAKEDD